MTSSIRFPRQLFFSAGLAISVMMGATACVSGEDDPDVNEDAGLTDDGGPRSDGGAPPNEPMPREVTLANLSEQVADATCGALFRCCNQPADMNEFFAIVASKDPSGEYASVISRVPPNAELSEADCPALIKDILDIDYLESWINAAENGYVDFRADEAADCLLDLDTAACGEPVREALYDATCFSLGAPGGGDEQRRVFERNAAVGDACVPIVDGFGAYYYGTCNPVESFCCNRHEDGDCITPSLSAEGTCEPIAAEEEPCSTFPVKLCATGVACAVAAGPQGEDICIQESLELLSEGALCYDDTRYISLGVCENGYCDYFDGNEKRCKVFLPDDATCFAGYECSSGACIDGVCGPLTTCTDEP